MNQVLVLIIDVKSQCFFLRTHFIVDSAPTRRRSLSQVSALDLESLYDSEVDRLYHSTLKKIAADSRRFLFAKVSQCEQRARRAPTIRLLDQPPHVGREKECSGRQTCCRN